MHPRETVDRALGLIAGGLTRREVARLLRLSERTVGHWARGSRRAVEPSVRCFRCRPAPVPVSYAYVLGMYLGDGHIVVGRRGVQSLSRSCDDGWPGIMNEVDEALRAVLGGAVCRVQRKGCTEVKGYSKHWTCLFPQHGPGTKHTREIRLENWQQQIVDADPAPFLRGLFHSDGCRATNRIRVRRPDGTVREYAYPRWLLSNSSDDILRLAEAALDRLGIAHRRNRPDSLSVARRDAVAALDAAIGPKT